MKNRGIAISVCAFIIGALLGAQSSKAATWVNKSDATQIVITEPNGSQTTKTVTSPFRSAANSTYSQFNALHMTACPIGNNQVWRGSPLFSGVNGLSCSTPAALCKALSNPREYWLQRQWYAQFDIHIMKCQ